MLLLSSSAAFSQNRLDPISQSVKCERSLISREWFLSANPEPNAVNVFFDFGHVTKFTYKVAATILERSL